MSDLIISEQTDLVAVFVNNGVDSLISEIEKKGRSFVADVATAKGRKEIASLAFAIARTKTALDDAGKSLVAEQKKRIGLVDADRKKVRDRLDALRDYVRRPLDEWEQAEKDRVAALEYRLSELSTPPSGTSADTIARIAWLESVAIDDSWHERATDAAKAKDSAIREWKSHLVTVEAAERKAAEEAVRIKAEAERAQREREERIAREAAERATREAEAAKAEAERRAEEAERRAKQAEVDAERKAREAVAKEAAERKQIAEQEEAARKKREDDKKHKMHIMGSACRALIAIGLSQDSALSAVTAISEGKIPHISISY